MLLSEKVQRDLDKGAKYNREKPVALYKTLLTPIDTQIVGTLTVVMEQVKFNNPTGWTRNFIYSIINPQK